MRRVAQEVEKGEMLLMDESVDALDISFDL